MYSVAMIILFISTLALPISLLLFVVSIFDAGMRKYIGIYIAGVVLSFVTFLGSAIIGNSITRKDSIDYYASNEIEGEFCWYVDDKVVEYYSFENKQYTSGMPDYEGTDTGEYNIRNSIIKIYDDFYLKIADSGNVLWFYGYKVDLPKKDLFSKIIITSDDDDEETTYYVFEDNGNYSFIKENGTGLSETIHSGRYARWNNWIVLSESGKTRYLYYDSYDKKLVINNYIRKGYKEIIDENVRGKFIN